MRRLLLLVLLLACTSAVAAQGEGVRWTVHDVFVEPDVAAMEYRSCAGGSFVHDAQERSFTFQETATASPASQAGCGEARWRVRVPAGTEHLHIRFYADRVPSGGSDLLPGVFVQQVRIEDVNGAQLAIFPVYNPQEGAAPETLHEPAHYPVPNGVEALDIVWWFADEANAVPPALGTLVRWSATVRQPLVEFSGVPLEADVEVKDHRSGAITVQDTVVRMPVDASMLQGQEVVLRVAVHDGLALQGVQTPSGRPAGEALTRNDTNRHTADYPLVVQQAAGLEVYLPAGMLEAHGPGTYTVVFREVSDVTPIPALVPLAGAMLLLPLPFAVAAVLGARAFQQEAFGGFRRAAQFLSAAVVVAVLYYLVVVVAAFFGQRLDSMVVWPLPPEALFLYIEVAVAIAAFILLWLVARELSRITRPAEGR